MDFYEILGVSQGASTEEIKRAYRKIARESHPDTHPGDAEAERMFKEATEVYDTLSDEKKRATYDRKSRPPESVLDLLRRPAGQRLTSVMLEVALRAPVEGQDTLLVIAVSAEVMREGRLVEVPNPRKPGEVLHLRREADQRWCRVTGLGKPGRNGADPGDLIVFVSTAVTPRRERERP